MSNSKQRTGTADSRQMTIEDYIAQISEVPEKAQLPNSADIKPQLRGLLNESIRESKKSRQEIAEEMTASLDANISVDQINTWTRDDKDRHIPLEYIHAFEIATNSRLITEFLCKLHGGKFVDERTSNILDLGQLQVHKAQLALRERELKKDLAK